MKATHVIIFCSAVIASIIALWPSSSGESPTKEEERTHSAVNLRTENLNSKIISDREAAIHLVNAKRDCLNIYGSAEEARLSIYTKEHAYDTEGLMEAGYSNDEVSKIIRLVSDARTEMEGVLASRLTVDYSRPELTSQGIQAYVIKEAREEGARILSILRTNLETLLGKERGTLIYMALRPTRQFGCFGRQEMHVQIREAEESPSGWEMAVQAIEPQTRVKLLTWKLTTENEISHSFGALFE